MARRGASGNRSTEDFSPALKAGNNNEFYQEATNGKWDTENGDGSGLVLTLNFDSRDRLDVTDKRPSRLCRLNELLLNVIVFRRHY